MIFLILILANTFPSYADQNKLKNYSESKKVFWKKLYPGEHKTLYCQKAFKRRSGVNIEHVFAASWMKAVSGCKNGNRSACRRKSPRFNRMEADLHNLHPTIPKINSARGSLIFDEIEESPYSESCPFEIGKKSVEPSNFAKGMVARALLYMQYEYGADLNKITNRRDMEAMLLKWHCKYPPTSMERTREEKIFKIQNTHNPFVLGEYDCSNVDLHSI